MKKLLLTSMLATPAMALALPAIAAPQMPVTSAPSIVEQARADCAWVNNKWTYRRGDKMLVCRPDRPRGSGWSWYREGNREGWYHNKRREWNHKAW